MNKIRDEQTRADIACAVQEAIVDVLAHKARAALEQTGLDQLVVAGGVGANRLLRERLNKDISKRGGKVFYPDLEFCTDNGAMIAFAGALRLAQQQGKKDYRFNVKPRWDLAGDQLHRAEHRHFFLLPIFVSLPASRFWILPLCRQISSNDMMPDASTHSRGKPSRNA